jgi:hypothetical protein
MGLFLNIAHIYLQEHYVPIVESQKQVFFWGGVLSLYSALKRQVYNASTDGGKNN